MGRGIGLWVVALLGFAAVARAQEADPTAERLDNAKQTFFAKETAFREGVLKELGSRRDRLVKQGSIAAADRVESDIAAFEADNNVRLQPPPSRNLLRQRDDARSAMVAAYQKAIESYTKRNLKDQADAIEAELVRFRKDNGIVSLSDLLTAGTTLRGEYAFLTGAKRIGTLELTIKARDGKRFRGTHDARTAGKSAFVQEVVGIIDGDRLMYQSDNSAVRFQVQGVVSGSQINAEFLGVDNQSRARCTLKLPSIGED